MPGSYLTDITSHRGYAMLIVENPTLATVLENENNGMNLLQVHSESACRIYARTGAIEIVETEKKND
jgi:hypothetical protein